MIRIQVPSATTDDFDRDTSGVVRDAIESKVRRLRFGLARSEKAIAAFEEKYHFPSSDLEHGKTVEDLESHEDYQEWVGEVHVRGRILAELDTLEHVVYERS
jgi:hypothetical protein